MDLNYQSFQPATAVSIAQNLTINGSPEIVNIITFSAQFANCIIPSGNTPTGYAEIFKPGGTTGEALISGRSPRIMAFNKTAASLNGLAAYSIATEQWNNGFSMAVGDLVLFSGATNPLPNVPYLAGVGTNLSSSSVECETLMKQLFKDVIRATISANSIAQSLYPIGSIYSNGTDTTDPAILFGFGTWAPFGAGRVVVSQDATQPEFDGMGETGGAKTHTLIIAELPAHDHTMSQNLADAAGANTISRALIKTGTPLNTNVQKTLPEGSGAAHNNLQPYIVAKMWIRTA